MAKNDLNRLKVVYQQSTAFIRDYQKDCRNPTGQNERPCKQRTTLKQRSNGRQQDKYT